MKRVLIAEDDAEVRKLLSAVLKEQGIEAVESADGLDAIKKLREEKCDLVIIDLMMPRIDGQALIRYLEEQRPPKTHAIVISGVRAEELDGVSHSSVVDAVMAKPVDVKRLKSQVQQSLQPMQ